MGSVAAAIALTTEKDFYVTRFCTQRRELSSDDEMEIPPVWVGKHDLEMAARHIDKLRNVDIFFLEGASSRKQGERTILL